MGCVLLLFLLGAVVFRCVYLAQKSTDFLFSCTAMGIAGMLAAQTVLNVGMCLYVAPVVGVTLPFFSYGGSSLLANFMALGLLAGLYSRA